MHMHLFSRLVETWFEVWVSQPIIKYHKATQQSALSEIHNVNNYVNIKQFLITP